MFHSFSFVILPYIHRTDKVNHITDCICNIFPEMNTHFFRFTFWKSSHFCGWSANRHGGEWQFPDTNLIGSVRGIIFLRHHTQVRHKCDKQMWISSPHFLQLQVDSWHWMSQVWEPHSFPRMKTLHLGQLCVPSYCKSVKSGQVLLRLITVVLGAFLHLLTVTPLQQFQHFLYDSLEGPTQILAAVGFS